MARAVWHARTQALAAALAFLCACFSRLIAPAFQATTGALNCSAEIARDAKSVFIAKLTGLHSQAQSHQSTSVQPGAPESAIDLNRRLHFPNRTAAFAGRPRRCPNQAPPTSAHQATPGASLSVPSP